MAEELREAEPLISPGARVDAGAEILNPPGAFVSDIPASDGGLTAANPPDGGDAGEVLLPAGTEEATLYETSPAGPVAQDLVPHTDDPTEAQPSTAVAAMEGVDSAGDAEVGTGAAADALHASPSLDDPAPPDSADDINASPDGSESPEEADAEADEEADEEADDPDDAPPSRPSRGASALKRSTTSRQAPPQPARTNARARGTDNSARTTRPAAPTSRSSSASGPSPHDVFRAATLEKGAERSTFQRDDNFEVAQNQKERVVWPTHGDGSSRSGRTSSASFSAAGLAAAAAAAAATLESPVVPRAPAAPQGSGTFRPPSMPAGLGMPHAHKTARRIDQLKPGVVLSKRFELLENRGSGSLGAVWKAVDQKSSRMVALKLLDIQHVEHPDRIERFLQSAKVTAGLRHPNIVKVLETSLKDGDLLFYAMEYLGGGNVRNAMMGGRLTREQLIHAVLEVAEGLIYAHKSGIIHKDIKPSNVLMRADGTFAITDFDLAWIDDPLGGPGDGGDGGMLYLAPEVTERRRTIDQASDVYSLGMTALFLLNGVDLVQSAPTDEASIKKLEAQKEVLAKAVEVERAKRFPTMKEFRDALRDADGKSSDKDKEKESGPDAKAEKGSTAEGKAGATARDKKERPATPKRGTGGDDDRAESVMTQNTSSTGVPVSQLKGVTPREKSPKESRPEAAPHQSGPHAPVKLVFPQGEKGEAVAPPLRNGNSPDSPDTSENTAQNKGKGTEKASAKPSKKKGSLLPSWAGQTLKRAVVITGVVALHAWAIWYLLLQTAETVRPDLPWVRIDGGSFTMGSREAEDEDARYPIRVSSFYILPTEVTVSQYQTCVNTGACSAPDASQSGCNWGKPGRDQHPVNCVTHSQARAYASWAGGRLPTEAEWEYAARGRGQPQKFPWGNDEPACTRAQFKNQTAGCGTGATAPVCSKAGGMTAQGLCDMAGNVWEWVSDYYSDDYYQSSPKENPTGPLIGLRKALRGGSYQDDGWGIRAANRFFSSPLQAQPTVGFRIVTAQPPTVGP